MHPKETSAYSINASSPILQFEKREIFASHQIILNHLLHCRRKFDFGLATHTSPEELILHDCLLLLKVFELVRSTFSKS
jgi:hypothetical protein